MNDDNQKIEILYDHYKDTFQYIREYTKQRDRIFIYTMIILVIVFLFFSNPSEIQKLLTSYLKEKTNLSTNFGLPFLNSMFLFLLLTFTIKYFQISLLIERSYTYISDIENLLKKISISREGQAYSKNYPKLLSLIHWFYTIIFPLILIIMVGVIFYRELNLLGYNVLNYNILFDGLVCFSIISMTFLYISWLHLNDLKLKKEI